MPLLGALAVRPGERVEDNPLRVAALLGIALALDLGAVACCSQMAGGGYSVRMMFRRVPPCSLLCIAVHRCS